MFTEANDLTTSCSTPTRNAGGYYKAAGEPQKEEGEMSRTTTKQELVKGQIEEATTFEQFLEIEKQIDGQAQAQRAEIRALRDVLLSAATGLEVTGVDVRLDELSDLLADEDEDGEPLDANFLAERWDEADDEDRRYDAPEDNLDRAYTAVELLRAIREKWYEADDPVLAATAEEQREADERARVRAEQEAAHEKAMQELAATIGVGGAVVSAQQITYFIGDTAYLLHAGVYGPESCRVGGMVGIVRPHGDLGRQKFMKPVELIQTLRAAVAA
jgi:hypothetical protein